MHSRDRLGGGWSAIIDPEEEGFGAEAEAQTDPHISRSELKFSDNEKTTVDRLDPATRAMLQRPDEAPIPKIARSVSKPVIAKSISQPGSPAKKLRLPLPGEGRKSGATETSTPSPRLSGPTEPAGGPTMTAPPVSFSTEQLVEKLSDGPAVPKAGGAGGQSFWVEYKELVRVAIIAVLAIAGVVAYNVLKAPAPAETAEEEQLQQAQPQPIEAKVELKDPLKVDPANPQQPQPQLPQQPQQPQPPEQTAQTQVTSKEETRPESEKAATPMVTISSSPQGALVEINGNVHGKTPLIMGSPRNIQELSIRLTLDGYKKWEENVAPNKQGHFIVNAKLESKR